MIFRTFGWHEVGFLVFSLRWTVLLTVIALTCGGIVGFWVAIARASRIGVLSFAASVYIQCIQGIPVLILLFLSYYGLGMEGISLPPLVAASLSMTVYVSSYLAEIWRGCIQAVPVQQWEASGCLAMTRMQQYRHIILPQAVRLSLPPTVGFAVQVVKNTSILSIIGIVELTRAGQLVNSVTYQPFRIFVTVAFLYFIICYPLSLFSRRLERVISGVRSRKA